jgi:hypothetical protein
MPPDVELPIIVLGFGGVAAERKLLAVTDGSTTMLPVFTEPEAAERYRVWQTAEIDASVLQIFATSQPEDYDPPVLNALVLDSAQQVRDVLEIGMMASGVTMIAVNPGAGPSIPCLCMDIEEFFEALGIF